MIDRIPLRPCRARRIRSVFGVLCAALLLLSSGTGLAAAEDGIFPFEVHETVLDNGLRVVVVPYDSPGIVAYFTLVRTGSRDEVELGHSGFAHFFEHMMFRGAKRYSQDDYNDALKRMGADSNATTSDDRTLYYIVGPKRELETMVDMESDRFLYLDYTEDVFRTEAGAILGEYNTSVSSPFQSMYERMRELAFSDHTYRHTTMGFLEDIKAMPEKYDYSLQFFDRHYRPENCVVIVVGDVTNDEVLPLVEKGYGEWESGHSPPEISAEPTATGPRSDRLAWAVPTGPLVMAGYRAPAFDSTKVDNAALDLAGQLLFSESAALYRELVIERQLVDFVQGGYADHRDPYLFQVIARAKKDEDMAEVLATIDRHIAKVQAGEFDDAQLERIKSHLRYAFALGLDSASGVANTIAHFLTMTGRLESINEMYERYDEVTKGDVVRMANEVLVESGRTRVELYYEGASR